MRPHDSEWRASAACAGVDSEVFFPATSSGVKTARIICAPCPVKADCLAFALDCDPMGVWAGTTRRERREMVRDRTRPVAGREQRQDALAKGRATATRRANERLDELAVLLESGETPERAVARMNWSIGAALKAAERQKRKDIPARLNPYRGKRKERAA